MNPEDPWSLEHWLDIVGTLLTAYAAYATATRVKQALTGSADDALAAAGALPDITDDAVLSAGLTQEKIRAIISIPKGQRPDPSTYLTQEYIDQHLDMFLNGVSKIHAHTPSGTIGPSTGTYVMPTSVADDLIRTAAGDIRFLEDMLCLERNTLGNTPVRIDVQTPTGLRLPSGNEAGANAFWVPGGYPSAGIPEAVIDQIQPGTYVVTPIK